MAEPIVVKWTEDEEDAWVVNDQKMWGVRNGNIKIEEYGQGREHVQHSAKSDAVEPRASLIQDARASIGAREEKAGRCQILFGTEREGVAKAGVEFQCLP